MVFFSLGLFLIVHFKNILRGKVAVEGLEKLKGANKESSEIKDKNKAFLLLTDTLIETLTQHVLHS